MNEHDPKMQFDEETLMAYVDGELEPETRAALETALPIDPELSARVEQHRNFRTLVGGAFDSVLDEEIPDRLLQTAHTAPASNVVSMDATRATSMRRSWSWPEWGAIAASLLVGIFVARAVGSRSDEAVIARDGRLIASGALAAALDDRFSGERVKGSDVQIGLSYRSKTGDYCRTFNSNGEDSMAGIVCRTNDYWAVQALVRGQAAHATTNYRMADTSVPPLILQIVQDSIDGAALDRQAEDAARAKRWSH
jgi:hypothetical protein